METTVNRSLSILTKIKVLFGGGLVQLGSLFFWIIVSGIAVYVGYFGWGIDVGKGDWVPAEGLYLGMESTNVTVNEEPVYSYYFSYSANNQSYQGVSYDYYKALSEETTIPVEYRANAPQSAKISGMDESPIGNWLIWILSVVALLPLGLLLLGFRNNQKYLYLLQKGAIAQGTYLRSSPTNTSINEQTVYKYEFSFDVRGMTYIATCQTHLYDRVEDEETETILYDPRDPNYNMVSDAVSNIKPTRKAGLGRRGRATVNQAGLGALLYPLLPVGGALIALYILMNVG